MKRSAYVEIVRLAAACCDQRISAEEHERLQLLLRSDAAARRVYLEYVDLHARLGQHPGAVSSPGMESGKSWLDEPRDTADGAVPTVAKVAETSDLSHKTPKPLAGSAKKRKAIRWLTLAASLTVVAAALSWWLLRPAPMQLPIVVRSIDAKTDNGQTLDSGSRLPRGELHLTGGLVELRSQKGAVVVIEAPARFNWPATERLVLSEGRASAEVPKAAVGFTIETPEAELQDLGTRFGVEVDPQGESRLHVFEGEVLARPTPLSKQKTSQFPRRGVRQGEAITIGQEGKVSNSRVRGSAFLAPEEVRALDAAWRAGQRRSWQKWVGSIRRDDALVLYSNFGPKTSDFGPQVTEGGSREAARVQGRWPGRRAMEFADSDDRIIVRFKKDVTLQQATLMAWVRLDVCRNRYQTLCFAPGSLPISRTDPEFIGRFQWSLNRESALRFAVVTGEDKPDSETSTFEGAAFSREGAPVPASRWQHLAVTYDSETRLVHFFTDGKLNNVAQPNVAPPLVIPGRLFLGNVATETATPRDLSGRLDEFVLLSRVLTEDEIRAAYENGNPYRSVGDNPPRKQGQTL